MSEENIKIFGTSILAILVGVLGANSAGSELDVLTTVKIFGLGTFTTILIIIAFHALDNDLSKEMKGYWIQRHKEHEIIGLVHLGEKRRKQLFMEGWSFHYDLSERAQWKTFVIHVESDDHRIHYLFTGRKESPTAGHTRPGFGRLDFSLRDRKRFNKAEGYFSDPFWNYEPVFLVMERIPDKTIQTILNKKLPTTTEDLTKLVAHYIRENQMGPKH